MRAKTLFVLDLDRTMANTRLYDVAEEVLRNLLGNDYELLRQARQQTEASGGSFDFIDYLEQNALPSNLFLTQFAARARDIGEEEFRNDGASTLLRKLTDYNIPFVFLTYGGEAWQRAKLAAAGYVGLPFIVTQTKEKGSLIAQWRDETGGFTVNVGGRATNARRIVLIDDKSAAFNGLPLDDSAHGYWLLQPGKVADGELGGNVEVIRSLLEINSNLYS